MAVPATKPWGRKLGPITKKTLQTPMELEEREYMLNQRLLESYYERLNDYNIRESRRLQQVSGNEQEEWLAKFVAS